MCMRCPTKKNRGECVYHRGRFECKNPAYRLVIIHTEKKIAIIIACEPYFFFIFVNHRFYSPAQLVRYFTPSQRPSGQAVATGGVFPSVPRHFLVVFVFFAREDQHSHFFSVVMCSSIVIHCTTSKHLRHGTVSLSSYPLPCT